MVQIHSYVGTLCGNTLWTPRMRTDDPCMYVYPAMLELPRYVFRVNFNIYDTPAPTQSILTTLGRFLSLTEASSTQCLQTRYQEMSPTAEVRPA